MIPVPADRATEAVAQPDSRAAAELALGLCAVEVLPADLGKSKLCL